MNIFSKEFGTAMLVLLIVFAAVLAVCGIATLITKLMKKDYTALSKFLLVLFAIIFLGTTVFYFVQLIPLFKEDKSMIGLLIGNRLVELAIGLMLMIMLVERTKKNWLSLLLSVLPAAYSIYALVTNFASLAAYEGAGAKAQAYVEYFGNVLVYIAVLVYCFLNTIGVIKNRKKAVFFGMIPAIIAALCFAVRFAFNAEFYPDDLVIVTAFDACKRALMVIWCYAMAVKCESVAPQSVAQPNPQPQPMPQQNVMQGAVQGFQNAQPIMQPQQPIQPATPVNNAPKFDPVTGHPIQPEKVSNE